jgi:hypothetical protein
VKKKLNQIALFYTPETRLFVLDGLPAGKLSKTLEPNETLKSLCEGIAKGLVLSGLLDGSDGFLAMCQKKFGQLADWDSN